MKRRRVKITGIGPVTPAGIGREAFLKGILEPVSRVRPYPQLDPDFGPFVAAYLDTFNIADYFDRRLVPKGAARQTLFAIAGAALALKDAGVSREKLQRSASAVLTGSCMMDFGGIVDSIDSVAKRGVRGVLPRVLSTMGLAGVATGVNQALGLAARVLAVSTQCSSGADALGHAANLVASGEVDIAVCGGTEAPLSRFPLIEIRAAEMTPATDEMPSRISRPFDRWRTTGVVAEGACMFVLEPEESPRPGYSYLAGYAYSNDEHDDLCGGLVRSGRLAMAEAGVRPNEIDSISAWGPGHKKVDAGEANAMQRLFGAGLRELPVVSIKGAVGTPLGAAAAMQVAAVALGQQHGLMPPTVNWEFPDPACPLNLSNRARAITQRLTLVNSHGLGGLNASLVLERC